MPLPLHEKCLTQLRDGLQEALKNAQVINGMFLSPRSSVSLFAVEKVLPTNGKAHEQIKKNLSETPVIDFVTGTLGRELFENQEYEKGDDPKPLTDVPEYADLPKLADRLVADFASLPWSYVVTVPLPQSFSEIFCKGIGSWQLSDRISIRCGDEQLGKEFPLASGIVKRDQSLVGGALPALLGGSKAKWDPKSAYLQIAVEGFIGKYSTTEPLLDAVGMMRAFFGLGVAIRLFKVDVSHQSTPIRERFYLHRRDKNGWIVEDAHELEPRHSAIIRTLKLHDLNGTITSFASQVQWMQSALSAIGVVLNSEERARNILLGAQWLLDSHCGTDELLQFVQAAVVVEILLGDKASSDQVGLGELLSNRCAYLIATSHGERNRLLQDFRSIYDVRSKIVHRGKSRLGLHERMLFDKLRWMCRRIIQEEVNLLKKDEIPLSK